MEAAAGEGEQTRLPANELHADNLAKTVRAQPQTSKGHLLHASNGFFLTNRAREPPIILKKRMKSGLDKWKKEQSNKTSQLNSTQTRPVGLGRQRG
jgi:hypothetical protein